MQHLGGMESDIDVGLFMRYIRVTGEIKLVAVPVKFTQYCSVN